MDVFLLPPLSCFLLAGVGGLLWRRRPKTARVFVGGGAALLFLLSLPLSAGLLLAALQPPAALTRESFDPRCGAIVVLAGDASLFAPEYGSETCGPMTLERLRFAAYLARETSLPILVSGGPPKRGATAHAAMMQTALERDFRLPVRWVEPWSGNTRDNVRLSIPMLRKDGIERAYVVTHAWHMPRALAEFERLGFEAVAAPTGFRASPTLEWSTFTPSAKALRESSWALHEWFGRAWYWISG